MSTFELRVLVAVSIIALVYFLNAGRMTVWYVEQTYLILHKRMPEHSLRDRIILFIFGWLLYVPAMIHHWNCLRAIRNSKKDK